MNYRKVYLKIIDNALKQQRIRKRKDDIGYVYYERHHILPKSLFPLWKQKKSNLVLLTAREHFFVHQLLSKIYPGPEMIYALWRFRFSKNSEVFTSRRYTQVKIKIIITDEQRKKISESTKKAMWKPEIRERYLQGVANARFSETAHIHHREAALKTGNLKKGTVAAAQKARQITADPKLREERRKNLASKIGRKVRCVTTNETFDSVSNAKQVQSHLDRYIDIRPDPKGRIWTFQIS